MRSVRWSRKALFDLDEAQSYIGRENPFAARAVAERIFLAVHRLAEEPFIGPPGIVPSTRHWVVPRTPYLLIYRVSDPSIEVLRVWHSRRGWASGISESVVERYQVLGLSEEQPALDQCAKQGGHGGHGCPRPHGAVADG